MRAKPQPAQLVMFRQRLREQSRLLDEVIQIPTNNETLQSLDRDLLNVRAITRRKHQRSPLQSGFGAQNGKSTRVVRREMARIGSGHSHADRRVTNVKDF